MFSFGLRIILLLLLIGGSIAYIGDYLGHIIGRKRLTLFHLRPRYTATFITIISGILISLITLASILIVSQDARTALFGLKKLRNELSEKSQLLTTTKTELGEKIKEIIKIDKELSKTKANQLKTEMEVLALEKTKKKLGEEINLSRQGDVLFKVDEVLITSIIHAGPEKEKLEIGLKQILSAADVYVRSFGVQTEKHLIFVPPLEFSRAIDLLKERTGENIVALLATRNTILGEEVPVRFKIEENKLIYKKGDIIAEAAIDPFLSVPKIEQETKKLLFITHKKAREAGIMPDASGSIGSLPYAKIYSLAKKIKTYKKGVLVKTVANKDTHNMTPLEIDFKVYYQ